MDPPRPGGGGGGDPPLVGLPPPRLPDQPCREPVRGMSLAHLSFWEVVRRVPIHELKVSLGGGHLSLAHVSFPVQVGPRRHMHTTSAESHAPATPSPYRAYNTQITDTDRGEREWRNEESKRKKWKVCIFFQKKEERMVTIESCSSFCLRWCDAPTQQFPPIDAPYLQRPCFCRPTPGCFRLGFTAHPMRGLLGLDPDRFSMSAVCSLAKTVSGGRTCIR